MTESNTNKNKIATQDYGTLIWYTGCNLFSTQSSTIFLTCFKPLYEPIAATVFPYTIMSKMKRVSN